MSRMLWLLPVLALGCQRLPPDTAGPPADTDVDTDTDSDADTDTDTDSDTDTATDDWPTGPTVRFVHWNIEFLGSTSSDEYQAAIRVLERLNGDVVFLNEVEPEEVSSLNAMADELGYDTVLFPSDNPFGSQRNALMSRLAVQSLQDFSSTSLSGDGSALDVTRNPVGGVFTLPDGGEVIAIGTHLKSGFGWTDEFRRAVDSIRSVQAAQRLGNLREERVLLLGDLNAEEDDRDSGVVTTLPSDLPGSYYLGQDLYGELTGDGIQIDPFDPMEDAGLEMVDARQLDGRDWTREESGRRIDYVWASDEVFQVGVRGEIYDPKDEDLDGALEKFGDAPDRDDAATASDHMPVFVDLLQ